MKARPSTPTPPPNPTLIWCVNIRYYVEKKRKCKKIERGLSWRKKNKKRNQEKTITKARAHFWAISPRHLSTNPRGSFLEYTRRGGRRGGKRAQTR